MIDEKAAAEALTKAGCILFPFPIFEGDTRTGWFVGVGSHGGEGETLARAMLACLDCCRLGMWWKLGNRSIAEVFAKIGLHYLEGWDWSANDEDVVGCEIFRRLR